MYYIIFIMHRMTSGCMHISPTVKYGTVCVTSVRCNTYILCTCDKMGYVFDKLMYLSFRHLIMSARTLCLSHPSFHSSGQILLP